jgi:hypothetical protein
MLQLKVLSLLGAEMCFCIPCAPGTSIGWKKAQAAVAAAPPPYNATAEFMSRLNAAETAALRGDYKQIPQPGSPEAEALLSNNQATGEWAGWVGGLERAEGGVAGSVEGEREHWGSAEGGRQGRGGVRGVIRLWQVGRCWSEGWRVESGHRCGRARGCIHVTRVPSRVRSK